MRPAAVPFSLSAVGSMTLYSVVAVAADAAVSRCAQTGRTEGKAEHASGRESSKATGPGNVTGSHAATCHANIGRVRSPARVGSGVQMVSSVVVILHIDAGPSLNQRLPAAPCVAQGICTGSDSGPLRGGTEECAWAVHNRDVLDNGVAVYDGCEQPGCS
ncbi:hypothetical protein BC827DRAFT_1159586 [Russula dissimulans]|nr:hypothetical protein BC827DRAFT_1159586 [Russula dissimulans]